MSTKNKIDFFFTEIHLNVLQFSIECSMLRDVAVVLSVKLDECETSAHTHTAEHCAEANKIFPGTIFHLLCEHRPSVA